jgi:hypothetical protein
MSPATSEPLLMLSNGRHSAEFESGTLPHFVSVTAPWRCGAEQSILYRTNRNLDKCTVDWRLGLNHGNSGVNQFLTKGIKLSGVKGLSAKRFVV